ncbi:PQQ-binding-like beta-propeller repeat protein [Streptomyces justiciae]|uniref:hypothetical protein n=1 Tax=Streptomyces justiciae TaxID=2780140 RepID=UPI0021191A95|nr:hypothetical protein [Streptomyces justiciae]MCW8379917.1 hypothetical protein [Streptomyces justiciae]
MTASLSVRRVLGDHPFAEIGKPSAVAVSEDRGLVAVGGDLGYLQWSGDGTGGSRWRQHRVGVYGTVDLRCRRVVESRWPVHSVAFHPTLPLAAVGTGSYDGGYFFEGELLLVHLESGRVTSVLRGEREVLKVEWESPADLRLLLAPPDEEEDEERAHTHAIEVVVERPDWGAVASSSVRPEELGGRWIAYERSAGGDDETERLAALTGEPWWEPRRLVWDVRGLADGPVLACLEEVLAEAWLPDGRLDWAVPDEEGGRQLVVRERDAWVNVERRRVRYVGRERVSEPPFVARVSLTDGKRLGALTLGRSVTFSTRRDGWLALRATEAVMRRRPQPVDLVPPGGDTPTRAVTLNGFDLFNHPFPIRRAGRLLLLQGSEREPWRDKWVVEVDPYGADEPRRLFPLDWRTPARHLFGGPGVEVGGDLVHAGAVHDGAGLLPGNAFVVRRSLTDGAPRWEFVADHPATAVDGDEDTVYVAYNSVELVALNALDGTVRWRQHLTVDGQPVVPLSLELTAADRLLIGTVDGRILDCSIAP